MGPDQQEFKISAKLMTEDGEQFQIEEQPVAFEAEMEIGRPPGVKPGSGLNIPLAPKFHGVSLPAGGYRWEVLIDGTQMATAPFRATT